MARAVSLAIAGLLLAVSARAELQFSPRLVELESEEGKTKHLSFSDGEVQISYVPPRGWEYSGNAGKLTLRPKTTSQAEATVTKVPWPKPGAFDEKTLKGLIAEALASLPEGSTNAALVSQESEPVTIGGKPTLLITLSYSFHGENFGRSIMFLHRGEEQLRFQLVSRLSDFKELQQAFLGSHFSWQNL